MTQFATALKNDLLDAENVARWEAQYDVSAVLGNLVNVINDSVKVIAENLTPAEELQYFRCELNKHLDWQDQASGYRKKDAAKVRKIVNDLTETSHLP